MKKLLYSSLALCALICALTACKKMDSTYKQFVKPGGIKYTGKASSAVAYVGRNRIKISWLRGTDPSVTRARIYWDNYTDSVEVPIPSAGDTISTLITGLEEKPYSFIVKTFNSNGNFSVPVEILTTVYGARYQEGLLARPLSSSKIDDAGNVTITWGKADTLGGAFATEVKYIDKSDKEQLKRFPVSQATSVLSNVKSGTTIKYNTLFLPAPLSIDTFYTDLQVNEQSAFVKTGWSVAGLSTEQPGAANVATNFIDGNAATRWHTLLTGSTYPHFIVVDMKTEKTITKFELFRMTAEERGCNTFSLSVSTDNVTWTSLGVFNFNRLSELAQPYTIPSLPRARYFKFTGLTGPQTYMVMGEINVYGY